MENIGVARVSYVVFFVMFHFLLLCLAQEGKRVNPKCRRFSCGLLGEIGFPFSNGTHPECGLCIVHDCDKRFQKIQLGKHGLWFIVSSISQDNTVMLRDPEYNYHSDNHSCRPLKNLTLPLTPFLSFEMPYNQTIFKCPLNYSFPTNSDWFCNSSRNSFMFYYRKVEVPSSLPRCSRIPFQVNKTQYSVEFFNLYTTLFALKVQVKEKCHHCHLDGGQCISDSKGNFHCSEQRTGVTNYSSIRSGNWLDTCHVFHALHIGFLF